VGAPAGDLEPPNPLTLPVQTLEEAYVLAERNNPVLAAAYSREKVSRGERALARADMLPRVDVRGSAQVGSVTPYSDRLRQTELRGEVVVSGPLFSSGRLLARASEADAANDADWRLIDQALRDNRLEVADAWNQWVAFSASVDSLARSVAAAQAAYDGALLQERAGFRTTLDVIDLARELLSARTNYNSVTTGAYLAKARLLAAIGMLDHSYLLPNAPSYDPVENYRRVKNDADIPLLTPLLSAIDGVTLGRGRDRPVRDSAGPLTAAGADVPVPDSANAPGLAEPYDRECIDDREIGSLCASTRPEAP
jgi:outer membrane protein